MRDEGQNVRKFNRSVSKVALRKSKITAEVEQVSKHKEKGALVYFRVLQSRYSCEGFEENRETSVRTAWKQVGQFSEYKNRVVVLNRCAARA